MNENTEHAGELTDESIYDCLPLGVAELSVVCGPSEIRTFARAVIAADRALRASPTVGDVTVQFDGIDDTQDQWRSRMEAKAFGYAPWLQADAQAALAAKDAAHEKQLNACKSLIASLERQRTTLREGAEKWAEAVKSLLSEREANAILTSEIARLQSDLARPESLAVGLMRAEISALTAERDALRKDAERYRWLRDSSNWSEDGICPIMASGEDTIYGEHLDQSIDAAMTKEPK